MHFDILLILSFVTGASMSAFLFTVFYIKKDRELAMLKITSNSSEAILNMVKNDFIKIASDTIKSEQEDLRKQNRESLEEKILPLTKELDEFKSKVDKFNISGVENTARILEQLSILEKNNKSIEQEAKNLTQALTKNQNIKGAFGEEIIETLLQQAGMTEGIHYIKQYSSSAENMKDESVHRIRPDFVINLPGNRHLIIDSKVTMKSYLDYTEDHSKIKEFKSGVKTRIAELSEKNYQNASNTNQPDFVLMYMPIDSAVTLLYEDSDIINYAYKSNIIIAGTSSILTIIRLVNQLYIQQKQSENIQQIVNAGTNLYETFVQFAQELLQIQKSFEGLSRQFTTAINRFSRTNKNKPGLFSQINELKNLGINTAKEIPAELFEKNITENMEGILIND